jgi:hypothetical protein
MALAVYDRVRETTTTTGTGTITLLGAVVGYQTFDVVGDGNTTYYTIAGQGTAEWEVGIGTFTLSGTTLARTTVLSNSLGTTALISFSAGTKDVFVTYPSEKAVYLDASGVVTIASSVLTTTDINAGTIDNASIGATTPSTGVFTQVDITAQGDLRLQDSAGGQYVGLQAPTVLASSYTLTLPVDDGTSGQALITDGSGALSWSSAASGDVYGPATATDNAIARFDGTTGKIIQNSAVTIADTTGDMAGVGSLGVGAITSTADSAFNSTGALQLPVGTTGQQPTGAVGKLRYNSTTNEFEGYSGSSPAWKSVGGSAISNDTTTATDLYPIFAAATTGTALNVYTSNAKYLYKPSTGELQAPEILANNGLIVNNMTIATSYSLPAGYSASSVGPVVISGGVVVTVPSGSRWVVL